MQRIKIGEWYVNRWDIVVRVVRPYDALNGYIVDEDYNLRLLYTYIVDEDYDAGLQYAMDGRDLERVATEEERKIWHLRKIK